MLMSTNFLNLARVLSTNFLAIRWISVQIRQFFEKKTEISKKKKISSAQYKFLIFVSKFSRAARAQYKFLIFLSVLSTNFLFLRVFPVLVLEYLIEY